MIYQHEIEERRARASAPVDREMPTFAGPEYWEEFDAYLAERGLSPTLARENEWYPSWDAGDSELRIVIPAYPAALKFWQARSIHPETKKRYQSPHGARGPSFIVVYPRFSALDGPLKVVVVEGPMDALAAADAGAIGVGLMGNTPSDEVLDLIVATFEQISMIVLPDRDSFREGATTLRKLVERGARAVMSGLPPKWKDLAEVPAKFRRKVIGL